MTFPEVYKALKEGKQLRRAIWDAGTFTAIVDGVQVWSCRGGPLQDSNPNGYLEWKDIDATDWEIA